MNYSPITASIIPRCLPMPVCDSSPVGAELETERTELGLGFPFFPLFWREGSNNAVSLRLHDLNVDTSEML